MKEMKENEFAIPATKKKSKNWFGIIALVLSLAVVGLYATGQISVGTRQTQPEKYSPELERLISANLEEAKLITERPDYLPEIMFLKINEKCVFPEDFYEVREMYRWNWIDEFSEKITECYWKQPEWTEDYETLLVPNLQKPPENRMFISSPAVYPRQAWSTIVINRKTVEHDFVYEFDKKVWVHTGLWGVDYTVVGLHPIFLSGANLEGKYNVQQKENLISDPEAAMRYFEISFDPNEFILEPSFPIYEWGYKKQITVHIKINTKAPDGVYILGFETGLPSKELDDKCISDYGMPSVSGARAGCYSSYHSSIAYSGRRFIQFVEIKSE